MEKIYLRKKILLKKIFCQKVKIKNFCQKVKIKNFLTKKEKFNIFFLK